MEIQDLRIFARVAQVQNLSVVGNEFDLSAGTISKRLQALEADLQFRLFDRTTRSIHITDEGRTLLKQLEPILGDLDAALANASLNVECPRGRLRVSAPTSLRRGVLAPAVCAFMTKYQEIEVQIDLTDRLVSFPESGYDVAIRTGSLADSSLIAKRLAADPRVVVAAPRYLETHGCPATPEDLAGHSCLVLGDAQTWTFVQGERTVDVRISGRLRSDNGELLRHAALEGLGLLRVSQSRVAADLESGVLRRVLEDYEAGPGSAIWAVYPSSRHVLPKLRVFLEFMRNWFREPQPQTATQPGRHHDLQVAGIVATGQQRAHRYRPERAVKVQSQSEAAE